MAKKQKIEEEITKSFYPLASSKDIDISSLTMRMAEYVTQDIPVVVFIQEISKLFLSFFKCDRFELWLYENQHCHRYLTDWQSGGTFEHQSRICLLDKADTDEEDSPLSDFEKLCRDIFYEKLEKYLPFISKRGSLLTGDIIETIKAWKRQAGLHRWANVEYDEGFNSVIAIPLSCLKEKIGLLFLKSKKSDFFFKKNIELYEELVRDLSFALITHQTQQNLQERVKELSCLYSIAHLATLPNLVLEDVLQKITELLPRAWQYPRVAAARIFYDGVDYKTTDFTASPDKQSAAIVIDNKKKGEVEVVYTQKMPLQDEGPFLAAERHLIDAIASEIALIITQKQVEEEHKRLHAQLMQADRLGTLGQVAAGVAHELNEPLGNILGFAQLAMKAPEMPHQTVKDLEKIVTAALHSREVIRKLLFFARQVPSKNEPVKLNEIAANGLFFLESRCAKAGIEMVRYLAANLPPFQGDASQIHQVLVNLVVNAIQAMPDGGTLTIRTHADDKWVYLTVQDTGDGIDEKIIKKIFLPFFTTKDINNGTGLGLAVVDDIVTAHRGKITVESKKGEGTVFVISFPHKGNQEETKEG